MACLSGRATQTLLDRLQFLPTISDQSGRYLFPGIYHGPNYECWLWIDRRLRPGFRWDRCMYHSSRRR